MAEGESPNGPDTGGPQPSGTEEESDEGLIQTFLIADIRGYTRFSQDHGDEAAGRLAARYAEVVTEVIEARGWRRRRAHGRRGDVCLRHDPPSDPRRDRPAGPVPR